MHPKSKSESRDEQKKAPRKDAEEKQQTTAAPGAAEPDKAERGPSHHNELGSRVPNEPQENAVDEASAESFPASDAPSFTPTKTGTDDR